MKSYKKECCSQYFPMRINKRGKAVYKRGQDKTRLGIVLNRKIGYKVEKSHLYYLTSLNNSLLLAG